MFCRSVGIARPINGPPVEDGDGLLSSFRFGLVRFSSVLRSVSWCYMLYTICYMAWSGVSSVLLGLPKKAA